MPKRVGLRSRAGGPQAVRSVTVNGVEIGKVRKTTIMGFELWVWSPKTDRAAPAAAQAARATPKDKQFASLAEIRRYFGD